MQTISFQPPEGHHEGAGSLYQDYIAAWIMSRALGIGYGHIRPEYVHHAESDPEYVEKWEQMFGFLAATSVRSGFPVVSLEVQKPISPNLSYVLSSAKRFVDLNRPKFERVKNDLRQNFFQYVKYSPKKVLWDSSKKFKIALHLRNANRNDEVLPYSLPWELFTYNYGPNQNHQFYSRYYSTILNKIKDELGHENVDIHVFSQGDAKDFEEIVATGATLHLDEVDALDSFWHFVHADVLVMAKSSFSYLACLLNPNVKIIRNCFRHYLPSEVAIVDDDFNGTMHQKLREISGK